MNICEDIAIKFNQSGYRYDLDLDIIGRAKLVQGRDKLTNQIYRLYVNEDVKKAVLNQKERATLISLVQRRAMNYKDAQISFENENTLELVGFNLYVYQDGVYKKVSDVPIEESYSYKSKNGIFINMGVGKVLSSAASTQNIDYTFTIRASELTSHQVWTIFPDFCAIPNNGKIDFYFFTNRYFAQSSLLESISEIQFPPSPEPRKVLVKVVSQTYSGETVAVGFGGG